MSRTSNVNKERGTYLIIGAAIFAYTLLFTWLSFLKHQSFFSFSYEEMSIYLNIIYNTSQGDFFFNSFVGNLFYLHFSLVYLYLGAAYFLFPNINTIFFITHFWIACGAIPIYLISMHLWKSRGTALCFSLFYLLSNPVHNLSFTNHDVLPSFAVTCLLFTFYFFQTKKFKYFVVSSLITLSIIEYAAFPICMFGVISCFMKDRKLRWKATPLLLGIGWIIIYFKMLMPLSGFKTYESIGVLKGGEKQNLISLIQNIITHPIDIIKNIFNKDKLLTIFFATDPVIFSLAIFSPFILLLGGPIFLKNLLAMNPYYLSITSYNHLALALPFVYIAALFSINKIFTFIDRGKDERLKTLLKRSIISFLFVYAIAINFGNNISGKPSYMHRNLIVGDARFLNIRNMFDRRFYTRDKRDTVLWAIINSIPKNASVSSSGNVMVPLAFRKEIYEFGTRHEIHDMEGHDFEVDFILLDIRNSYHGFDALEVSNQESKERINEILNTGYKIKTQKDGFILFEKIKKAKIQIAI